MMLGGGLSNGRGDPLDANIEEELSSVNGKKHKINYKIPGFFERDPDNLDNENAENSQNHKGYGQVLFDSCRVLYL